MLELLKASPAPRADVTAIAAGTAEGAQRVMDICDRFGKDWTWVGSVDCFRLRTVRRKESSATNKPAKAHDQRVCGRRLPMDTTNISLPKDRLAAFCRKNHVATLSFFGSVLREDFGPDSDVDVLVEFEEGHVPGMIGLARMEEELSALFGRKVDLRTPRDLSRYFRDEVVRSAAAQYARR